MQSATTLGVVIILWALSATGMWGMGKIYKNYSLSHSATTQQENK